MTNPIVKVSSIRPWMVAAALCWRECLRFFRQRNRVIGAVGQPILFWMLLGTGMNSMFQVEGQSYGEYYFPGTMVLVLLFTAIFATISIIEDRQEGFLQSVLVAPAPRWSMVLGKVLGGTLIALLQGMVFLLLSLTIGIRFGPQTCLAIVAWMFVSALALNSLGFALAWRMESTQGFHAIMNLLLMPMWLLSGAFFPIPPAAGGWSSAIMHWVMRCNPVTFVVAGLRQLLYAEMPESLAALRESGLWMPGMRICCVVVIGFAVVTYAMASRVAGSHTRGDIV